jgi:uncharacterized protein with FMN-binding domain
MKIFLIVLGVIVAIAAGGYIFFTMSFQQMQKTVNEGYSKVTNVDLTQVPDGIYNGKAGEFVCSVDLDVVVKDHKISAVVIKDQMSGPEHKALDMTNKIVSAQSPKTDMVSGASGTSKVIMSAVYEALTKK